MPKLLKIFLVFIAIILLSAIVAYFIPDKPIKIHSAKFNYNTNKFLAEIEKDPTKKQKYQEQAAQAQKEFERLQP